MDILSRLYELRDEGYRTFQAKLIPNLPIEAFIGVRTPQLRQLAKEVVASGQAEQFLAALPHQYFDEYQLHSFIISLTKDYDTSISQIDTFLPYVDNWATCDQLAPKSFKSPKNHQRLLADIQRWMSDGRTYVVRFGIEMLMTYYLDDEFRPEYLQWVASIRHQDYYVHMMMAWYFSFALIKQYEATVPFFESPVLDPWVHNKSIQKGIESLRISEDRKAYLRTLKIK